MDALHATAAVRGQPVRLIDAWQPVDGLGQLPARALAEELSRWMPKAEDDGKARSQVRAVWQCQVRAHPDQAPPTDALFVETAHRILAATGIGSPGEPHACRSATFRIGEHEIRIIATLFRPDGTVANPGRDRSLALAVYHLMDARAPLPGARTRAAIATSPVAAPPAATAPTLPRPLPAPAPLRRP